MLTAVNGEEAISSFDTTIKLIIMECARRSSARVATDTMHSLMMPVLDGLEATRRIRKLDGGSSVAICAFTASSATETHAAAQALGMKVRLRPRPSAWSMSDPFKCPTKAGRTSTAARRRRVMSCSVRCIRVPSFVPILVAYHSSPKLHIHHRIGIFTRSELVSRCAFR